MVTMPLWYVAAMLIAVSVVGVIVGANLHRTYPPYITGEGMLDHGGPQ